MVNSIQSFLFGLPNGANETKLKLLDSKKFLDLFYQPKIAAACNLGKKEIFPIDERHVIGGATGALIAALGLSTGPLVALHEIVGHGLLGFALTNSSGTQGVTYQVDGWDNLKAIGNSHSFQEGVVNFFRWIIGYDADKDGFAGMTHYPGHSDPNGMGQAMGADGLSAWRSIAGSIPGLALDTLSVVGGMFARKKSPVLGSMMVGFGLSDHASSAAYPIGAAMMSNQEMQTQASRGNDFANFALHMSHLTGISAEAIAISTAAIWTSFVPLAALMAYLYTRSHSEEAVPDALAIKHWLQKAAKDPNTAKELANLVETYPNKAKLLKACEITSKWFPSTDEIENAQSCLLDFVDYLLRKLPAKTIETAKCEIAATWEKNLPQNRVQKALTISSLAGGAASIASKVLTAIAPHCSTAVQTAASAFTYAAPLFIATSVLSTAYQVYQDFRCPDSTIPKSAKMLSIARLIVSIAYSALLITSLFAPGLNIAFFVTLFLGGLINLALSFARMRVIRKQFELQQALEPNTWNFMHALWLNHQKKPAGTKMSAPLKKWVECLAANHRLPRIDHPKRSWLQLPSFSRLALHWK